MSKLIFINLPVTDLPRSTSFYEALGARQDERFSGGGAACMVLSDVIHVMLHTHDSFRRFTSKAIIDARTTSEVLLCISAESRQEVDAQIGKGAGAGGTADPNPVQDHGFMYGRSLEDPDGHVWEVVWMDMTAFLAAQTAGQQAA